MSAPKWAKGMQKVGPGIYVRGRELHVSHEEIAAHLGMPLTADTRALIERCAIDAVREAFPDSPPIEITEVEDAG
jgi:hypothetical protein